MTAVDKVIRMVASDLEIRVSEIKGRSRKRRVLLARQLCMYLLWQSDGLTLQRIGLAIGNRTSTTVSRGYQVIALRIRRDPVMCDWVERMGRRVNGSHKN